MRKIIIFLGTFLFLAGFCFAADETLITTYYPSPYGYYKELKVNRGVTYAPVTSLPGDGKEGELVFFNNDKKFYYYSAGQWRTLGGVQTPLSITGIPSLASVYGSGCYAGAFQRGSWSYSFPQPVNMVALEVQGSILFGLSLWPANSTLNWSISATNNRFGGHVIKKGYQGAQGNSYGTQVMYGYDSLYSTSTPISGRAALSKGTIDQFYQGITSLTVSWDMTMSPGTPGSWTCATFSLNDWPPTGTGESVTVYYNPA